MLPTGRVVALRQHHGDDHRVRAEETAAAPGLVEGDTRGVWHRNQVQPGRLSRSAHRDPLGHGVLGVRRRRAPRTSRSGSGWDTTTADDGWWLDDIQMVRGTVEQQVAPQADTRASVGGICLDSSLANTPASGCDPSAIDDGVCDIGFRVMRPTSSRLATPVWPTQTAIEAGTMAPLRV